MRISFDLDDVLASFQEGWIEFNNSKYGTNLKLTDFNTFHYTEVLGVPMDEVIKRLFEFYQTDIFENLKPEPGAQEVVERLAAKHDLFVLTSRPAEIQDLTRYWIRTNFENNFIDVLTSGQISREGFDQVKVTKATICLNNSIDIHIEDSSVYAGDTSAAGVQTYLIEKPWNLSDPIQNQKLQRVKHISELLTHL